MSKKAKVKVDTAALDKLKAEYLALEDTLTMTRAEIYWKQGRLLIQIKAIVETGTKRSNQYRDHGRPWITWVEQNLSIDRHAASRRMAIGMLPHLPSAKHGTFHIDELQAISVIVRKENISPDAAAATYRLQHPKRKIQRPIPQPDRPQTKADREAERARMRERWARMDADAAAHRRDDAQQRTARLEEGANLSRDDAFAVLGIDVHARTITKETLTIIEKGLRQRYHPDKGGTSKKFIAITKAVEVLS